MKNNIKEVINYNYELIDDFDYIVFQHDKEDKILDCNYNIKKHLIPMIKHISNQIEIINDLNLEIKEFENRNDELPYLIGFKKNKLKKKKIKNFLKKIDKFFLF